MKDKVVPIVARIRHILRTSKAAKVGVVVLPFALIGVSLLALSSAATNTVTIEAESGNLSRSDMSVAGTGASGNMAVNFTAGGSTNPPGGGDCTYAGSGEAMPTADDGPFKVIFADDFCVDSAIGSWGSEDDSSKIVYTGNGPKGATKWTAYPKTFKDTYDSRPYRSDAVLSTHDGALDFHLHQVDGMPAGANPSPLVDGSSKYQTYGRYSVRFKVVPTTGDMHEYYAAWLLWPDDGAGGRGCEAESDYPEGGLDGTVSGFAHNGCDPRDQDSIDGGDNKFTDWHTYTQDWEPGKRTYYVDGQVIGESTKNVYDGPERWQLQTETNGDGDSDGHLILDWAVVWKYQP